MSLTSLDGAKLQWGDVKEDTPIAAVKPATAAAASTPAAASSSSSTPAAVDAVTKELSQAAIVAEPSKEGEEDEVQLNAYSGLHPNDKTAEVTLKLSSDDSASSASAAPVNPTIYKAIQTFEQLGLSKEILSGVYAMKFETPSKIQAQALPIITAPNHPNLIGQAHHGSGKCWGRGTKLLMFDGSSKVVEDIARDANMGVKQLLMGDDNTPRTVQFGSGIARAGQLFRVESRDQGRDQWSCNADHVLVLQLSEKPHVERQLDGSFAIIGWTAVPTSSDDVHGQRSFEPVERQVEGTGSYASVQAAESAMFEMFGSDWSHFQPLVYETIVSDWL